MIEKLKERGITLIALVVTIIILLILAGVTLNIALSDNGLIKKSQEAVNQQKINEYIEKIELARGEVALNNLGEVTLEKLKAQIVEDGIVNEEAITDIPTEEGEEEKAKITTKEGYIFEITANTTRYAGTGEAIPNPPDLVADDITFTISKENEWAKEKDVTIERKENDEKFTLQYRVNEGKWQDYKEAIKVTENNTTIYVRQRNSIGESSRGTIASKTIDKIDTVAPKKVNPSITKTNKSITINVNDADDEDASDKSGKSEIEKIYYSCYTEGAEQNWKECEATKKTYDFTGLEQGTEYKIQVKLKDKAGNETITDEQLERTINYGTTIQTNYENIYAKYTNLSPKEPISNFYGTEETTSDGNYNKLWYLSSNLGHENRIENGKEGVSERNRKICYCKKRIK